MNESTPARLARQLNEAGVPPEFGPDRSRVLVSVMKAVAQGSPVDGNQVDQIIADLGVDRDDALEFLSGVSERDGDDSIVGLVGLSQNESWVHRFTTNGKSLRTWCAWDTLFVPLLLDQDATVESESPTSKTLVKVRVSPEHGIQEVEPKGAVVSVVALNPEDGDMVSVEDIWAQFCHQVYFFASREEAEAWSEGRQDIEILSVEEAFEMGELAFSNVLQHTRVQKAL